MDHQDRFEILIAIGIVLIGIILILIWRRGKASKEEIQIAKEAYEKALSSGDRKQALQAGREYYSLLRGGQLTIYDEQALSNDLNTI